MNYNYIIMTVSNLLFETSASILIVIGFVATVVRIAEHLFWTQTWWEVKAVPNEQESKLVEKWEMDNRTYDLVRSNVLFSGLSFISFYSHCLPPRTTWPGLSGQAVVDLHCYDVVGELLAISFSELADAFLLLTFAWVVCHHHLKLDNLVNHCHYSFLLCF